ncbi:MAG: STAS domain-containing protein, partial [Arcobacteraceae bacterium]
IDIKDVPFIDITAIFALMDLVEKLQSKKIVTMIILNKEEKEQLLKIDKNGCFKKVLFYSNINEAVKDI